MIGDGLLPAKTGRASAAGAPERTVLIRGGLVAVFTAYGSLDGITSFGSLAFMVVFGAMSYLALGQRDHDEVSPHPPAIGVAGTSTFFVLLLGHLWTADRGTFFVVLGVTAAVLSVELLYFERETIDDGFQTVEEEFADDFERAD